MKIILDLDDVLNTFTLSALAHVGSDISEGVCSYKPEWGMDIARAARELGAVDSLGNPLSDELFWAKLDRRFWATIPRAPWFFELLALCRKYDKGDLSLCTRVTEKGARWKTSHRHTLNEDCLLGKMDWIADFIPDEHSDLRVYSMFGGAKHLLSRPGSVLIDDSQDNIEMFSRYGGGKGILFPRPWNGLSHLTDYPLDYVKVQLWSLE